MDKPITIARQDFIEDVVGLINGSGLPAFVIIDSLEALLPALRTQAEQQYQADLAKYKEGDQNG